MDLTIISLSGFLILIGLLGSFLPVIPGPLTSWLGLFILRFSPIIQIENSLLITSNKTGISRDHCTLIMKNDRCILNDLSRYGTYLNNQRIKGPSILNIGDKIRIGSPGIEITLITIGKTFGS